MFGILKDALSYCHRHGIMRCTEKALKELRRIATIESPAARIRTLVFKRWSGDGIKISLKGIPLLTRLYMNMEQYEFNERRLAREYLLPHLPVIELGAGIGVVSCIAEKCTQNNVFLI